LDKFIWEGVVLCFRMIGEGETVMNMKFNKIEKKIKKLRNKKNE